MDTQNQFANGLIVSKLLWQNRYDKTVHKHEVLLYCYAQKKCWSQNFVRNHKCSRHILMSRKWEIMSHLIIKSSIMINWYIDRTIPPVIIPIN